LRVYYGYSDYNLALHFGALLHDMESA